MDRRAFLAGVGAVGVGVLGTGAAYAALLGDGEAPYRLRVVRGEQNWTDVRCELSPDVVRAHPTLEEALQDAEALGIGEELSRGLGPAPARRLRRVLEECDPTTQGNGLYKWNGKWYLIGIIIVDEDRLKNHHHTEGGDHQEAGGNATTTDGR